MRPSAMTHHTTNGVRFITHREDPDLLREGGCTWQGDLRCSLGTLEDAFGPPEDRSGGWRHSTDTVWALYFDVDVLAHILGRRAAPDWKVWGRTPQALRLVEVALGTPRGRWFREQPVRMILDNQSFRTSTAEAREAAEHWYQGLIDQKQINPYRDKHDIDVSLATWALHRNREWQAEGGTRWEVATRASALLQACHTLAMNSKNHQLIAETREILKSLQVDRRPPASLTSLHRHMVILAQGLAATQRPIYQEGPGEPVEHWTAPPG